MNIFRTILASLAALLIAAQPSAAGALKLRGAYLVNQASLGALALSTPTGTAGSSGSSAITGATPGSTLTMQDTVGGLYSVDSGARSLIWTSGVVAGTDNPVVRETLAGFSNSPRDNTLPVTIAASGYTTGQSIAKPGPVQYPNLLDANAGTNTNGVSIPYRPPWAVAGVDYRVGPSSTQSYAGKTLPGDAANLPACAAYVSSIHYVRFDPPCTFDGWDFGNIGLYNNGGTGTVIIRNSKFDNTAGNDVGFYYGKLGASTDLIEFNDINGGYFGSSQPALITVGSGSTTIQMNYFHNAPEDVINAPSGAGTTAVLVRWNLSVNQGWAWYIHGDFFQAFCDPGCTTADFNGIDVNGNTTFEQNGDASNLPATLNTRFRLGDNLAGADFVSPTWHHDTMVDIGVNHTGNNAGSPYNAYPGAINVEQVGDATATGRGVTTNWTVHDNYYFSNATTWASTQRTVFGIYAQAHVVNVTYTISPNNVFMWDGTNWPTTLP